MSWSAINCDHRKRWRRMLSMTLRDMCADIAALLHPMPAPVEHRHQSADASHSHAPPAAASRRPGNSLGPGTMAATGKQREKAWSLAAAARAAREARIAAVRYMREAAIEREWQAAVLSYGHQAWAARSGNPDGARVLLFPTMGYPPPYPDCWGQANPVKPADRGRYLARAGLVALTPPI